ncbi:MAG: hypothetical protein DRQ99_25920, partial [Candidatus Parabeggiatoa sp. nov. 3]
ERKAGRKINLERKAGRKINLERKAGRKITCIPSGPSKFILMTLFLGMRPVGFDKPVTHPTSRAI